MSSSSLYLLFCVRVSMKPVTKINAPLAFRACASSNRISPVNLFRAGESPKIYNFHAASACARNLNKFWHVLVIYACECDIDDETFDLFRGAKNKIQQKLSIW